MNWCLACENCVLSFQICRSDCEFLEKLDLTVNFVDVDKLKPSCDQLSRLEHLHDLYMTGNPCTDWSGFRDYVIARAPQIKQIDGEDVTRTEIIQATQKLPILEAELAELAASKAAERKAGEEALAAAQAAADAEAAAASAAAAASGAGGDVASDAEESSPWCPEERVKIAQEVAAQKAEDDKKHDHLRVPERDYEAEHKAKLESIRKREEEEARLGERVRARNEAKLEFKLDGEDGKGNVVLELALPRFLDSSLINVDAHPGHVSIVVRGKLFRIAWPEEVVVAGGKATRSSATGTLTLTMPKARQSSTVQRLALEATKRDKVDAERRRIAALEASGRYRRLDDGSSDDDDDGVAGAGGFKSGAGQRKLADEVLETARLAGAVDVANIVDDRTRRKAGLRTDAEDEAAVVAASNRGEARTNCASEFGGMKYVAERRKGAATSAASEAASQPAAYGSAAARRASGTGRKAKPLIKQYRAAKSKKTVAIPGLIQELTGLDAELVLE